jgi:hypothetical protein
MPIFSDDVEEVTMQVHRVHHGIRADCQAILMRISYNQIMKGKNNGSQLETANNFWCPTDLCQARGFRIRFERALYCQ